MLFLPFTMTPTFCIRFTGIWLTTCESVWAGNSTGIKQKGLLLNKHNTPHEYLQSGSDIISL